MIDIDPITTVRMQKTKSTDPGRQDDRTRKSDWWKNGQLAMR